MRKILVVMAAAAALIGFGRNSAAQTTSALSGVIVAVAMAPATPEQVGYQQVGYQPQSSAGSVAGGVLGAAVGAVAGRNMRGGGSWVAGGAGGAIGALIGHMVDQRHDEQVARQASYANSVGAQVIVRLDGGQTVAVFSRRGGLYPGQKVWVVGGAELIPAG